MSEETKILDRCERLFMKYGVKSVTMDDISRELGISKKTLYQHFENKDVLINKVTNNHFEQENIVMHEIITGSKTAIDEMMGIAFWMNHHMKHINPAIIFDLKKYHPTAWEIFIQHRNTEIYNSIKHNVERGKAEGLYREDLHADIIARIYISKAEMFIDPDIFPPAKYPIDKTFSFYIDYHVRGLATPKGIKYLEKIKSQTNE